MALYKYKASDKNGKIMQILIEGDTQDDALNRLRGRGLMPLQCFGEAASTDASGLSFKLKKRFNVYEFTNRLVPLLSAHIQLERALSIIAGGMDDNPAGQEVVNSLRRGLHEGKKFSELIRNQGDRFPRIYANLVETGEATGCLTEVMHELQRFLNDSRELRDFVITSMIYPAIILGVTIGVIVLLLTVLIPRFSKIFLNMGRELPLPTQIMMNISDAFIGMWWVWPLLIIGICIFFNRVAQGGKAKDIWDKLLLKFPITGELVQAIEISRFIRTMAILLQNHVHLLPSVKISVRVIQNGVIAAGFARVDSDLRGGAKLSASLKKSPHMPMMAIQMMQVGEESGNIGQMLDRVADEQEKNIKVRIKRLLALFEPAVIILLAAIIFMVVISIFVTVMEMNEI
jgi:general secretion pathway protein F